MSAIVELGEKSFQEAVEKEGILFIDFWAAWCGPCRAFAPTYERFAAAHPDVTFAKVDTDQEQALAGALGIRSIPTLMIFRDGLLLFSQAGALPEAALDDLLRQARALDMSDVKARIAEQEAAASDPPAST